MKYLKKTLILVPILGAIYFASFSQKKNNWNKVDWANIVRYKPANKALGPPKAGEKRVVFMGNSITDTWATSRKSFFVNNNYIGRGISGQTTMQMLVRFRSDVINLKPKVVVILAGINDIAENGGPTNLHNITNNIISMTELAKANGMKVILCSVLPTNYISWRQHIDPRNKIINLNKMLKGYADRTEDVSYANYYDSMVDDEKGLKDEYSSDRLHPHGQGYKVMEPIIKEAIDKVL